PKLEAGDHKYLCSWRITGCAEQRRDGNETSARGFNVERWSDQKFNLGVTARTLFSLVLEEHFNANIKLAVDHRIGKRLAHGNLSFAPAAGLLLEGKISAPTPTLAESFTKQEFRFPLVRLSIVEIPFAVQRRIQRNLSPLGQCVTQLDAGSLVKCAAISIDVPVLIKI